MEKKSVVYGIDMQSPCMVSTFAPYTSVYDRFSPYTVTVIYVYNTEPHKMANTVTYDRNGIVYGDFRLYTDSVILALGSSEYFIVTIIK